MELAQGDRADTNTDALVNPANARLIPGGSVAGAMRGQGDPAQGIAKKGLAGPPSPAYHTMFIYDRWTNGQPDGCRRKE